MITEDEEDDRPMRRRKKVKKSDKPFRVDDRRIMTNDNDTRWKEQFPWMFEFRERGRFRTREEADRFVAKLSREMFASRHERRVVDESEVDCV